MIEEEKKKLLETKIDLNTTVKNASALTFLQWCLKKVDGANANLPEVREIIALNSYPGTTMTDDQKLEILIKLKNVGLL